MKKIENIANQFQLNGNIFAIDPFGNGHIHDTYRVTVIGNEQRSDYILQRINRYVFIDPPGVMENILRVTQHIRGKWEALSLSSPSSLSPTEIDRRTLHVILTRDGDRFYKDNEGEYWRVYNFIPHSRSLEALETHEQLYQAAFLFGQFLSMLADLPAPPLNETIRDFHHGPKRFHDFLETLKADAFNRAKNVKPEIDFLYAHHAMFDVLPERVREGKIPIRITHNDTKVNNILFDQATDTAICVIDLDTVMPGLVHFDFGDLARTTIYPAAEDERDLSKVSVQVSRFESILKGYLDGTGGCLTSTEKEYLVFSTKLMTLMVGTRFLTDYLAGDTYFKIHRPSHNLDRARRQFKLVECLNALDDPMGPIGTDCAVTV
ncbi:MAG: phosphotransferase enzyme family protein [Candidatus Omnitrophota bacterium]